MIKYFNVESRGGAQVESKVSTTKRILIKHFNVQSSMGQVLLFSFSLSSSFGGEIINNRNAWVGFILNRDIVSGEVGTARCYRGDRHPEKSTYYC